MVKAKEVYVNEITGQSFGSEEEAKKSEEMHRDILETFSFYVADEDKGCDFSNGKYAVQRGEEFYLKLIDGIIKMVKKYEKGIWKEYKKHGGVKREYVKGHTLLGRHLDDRDSPMYHWWGIQGNICQKCFREYGQMYYATNCTCSDDIKTIVP